MPDTLHITLVQSSLHWENPEANRLMFDKLLAKVRKTDLILLPEMFTSGFTMHPGKVAEDMQGPTVCWMQTHAQRKKAVVCGSLVIREGKKYFNRFIWSAPNGELFTYDKRHLFSMANEHKHYTAGTEKIIVHYKGWNICPLVCYDLRFPVWSRNVNNGYDLLLYTANWPKPRVEAWSKLLEARAIENQCYVMGVNRIGKDGTKKEYTGHSAVIDPKGSKISKTRPNTTSVETVRINLNELNSYRKKFPLMDDADAFTID